MFPPNIDTARALNKAKTILISNVLRVISYSQEYNENEQLKTRFSQLQLLNTTV